jgi:hypothetical protein
MRCRRSMGRCRWSWWWSVEGFGEDWGGERGEVKKWRVREREKQDPCYARNKQSAFAATVTSKAL